jgi:hypothetical protein
MWSVVAAAEHKVTDINIMSYRFTLLHYTRDTGDRVNGRETLESPRVERQMGSNVLRPFLFLFLLSSPEEKKFPECRRQLSDLKLKNDRISRNDTH